MGAKPAATVWTQPVGLACLKGWNYFKADFDMKLEGGGVSQPSLVCKTALLGGCFFTEHITLK